MFSSSIKNFRIITFIEGISFLVLLFVAMPMKYFGGNPIPVKIVGMTHGILFILFIGLLYLASIEHKWNWKYNVIAILSSLIPFGTFFLDSDLKKKELNSIKQKN